MHTQPPHHHHTSANTVVERLTPRERLVAQRAEAAFARTPVWLGAGRRWQEFVEPSCPCCAPTPHRKPA